MFPICKVSEQPSESCSVIDENENILVGGSKVQYTSMEENASAESSGSKNSDKENSNLRNNKDEMINV